MSKRMVQIRNVPERVHRTLKARAAQAGMALSDRQLSWNVDSAAAVRAERDARKRSPSTHRRS